MIAGILLAAGASSRFHADKLLHPLRDGTPVGVRAAHNLCAALNRSVAVVRPDQRTLAGRLRDTGLRVIACADAHEGMGASLACGVRATAGARGWLIALADMPFIRPATIRTIADRIRDDNIVAPAYAGRRGHPVGFGRRFRENLLGLRGDRGARDVLAVHASTLDLITCDDAGVLRDIDRRQDLGRDDWKIR